MSSISSRFIALSSLAALLSTCGSSGLSALTKPTLSAQIVGTPVLLTVGFSDSSCPTISSATATLNGSALAITSLGGPSNDYLGHACNPIQFTGTVPPSGDATFEVKDGASTWTMTVPGYFSSRSLAVTSPGYSIHIGDTVTATAVPDTDTFDTAPTPSGMFLSDDGAIEFGVKDNLTVTGATFQFVVPQTLSTVAIPAAGAPGTLTINPGIPMAQVTSCKGPSKCTAVLDTDYAAKVTLLP